MSAILPGPGPRTMSPPLAVAEQVAIARQAQPLWAATPLAERLAAIRQLRHLLAAQGRALAEVARTGRTASLAEVMVGEVLPLADACRFLVREARVILRPRRLARSGRPAWLAGVDASVQREPWGVVLIIGPANYPLFLPAVQAIQALAAGNAVVLKPGTGGSDAAHAFLNLCTGVGLGPPYLQVLGESTDAAQEAIQANVDKVVLTGSAITGQQVLAQLASRLVPATMELSGCDAAFVRADADLAMTARALRFGLQWNGGATCIAPRRVFVVRECVAALEEHLQIALSKVPRDLGCSNLAPDVRALVEEAVRQGARLLRADGPVIVLNARTEMRLLQHELCGPILAIVPVDNEEEALRAAERCPYALGATVFGTESAAREFAERVNAGVVVVNDMIVPTADPRLPFGGRGRSGYGVTRGNEGLIEMTRPKVIIVRGGWGRWHLDEATFSDHELVQDYLQAAHGCGWLERWRAGRSLIARLFRKGWKDGPPKEQDK